VASKAGQLLARLKFRGRSPSRSAVRRDVMTNEPGHHVANLVMRQEPSVPLASAGAASHGLRLAHSLIVSGS